MKFYQDEEVQFEGKDCFVKPLKTQEGKPADKVCVSEIQEGKHFYNLFADGHKEFVRTEYTQEEIKANKLKELMVLIQDRMKNCDELYAIQWKDKIEVRFKKYDKPQTIDEACAELEEVGFIKSEPKKTLWDSRVNCQDIDAFLIGDVKEALKEYIDWLNEDEPIDNVYTRKAKEIFGKELIEDE